MVGAAVAIPARERAKGLCKRASYALAGRSGLGRLLLSHTRTDHLRILTYHGICPDELSGQGWLPPHFVTLSEFSRQMEYITAQLNPVHLHDAIRYYRQHRRFPSRSVAITFDDGYENNLTLASPVLERYGAPATIFLSTRWVEEGGLFPFDRLRLLRWWKPELGASIPRHKKASIHAVLMWLDAHWPECQASLRSEQSRALRPLSWAQVRACSPARIRFGAHTHRHAILGNENRGDRRDEILTSVRLVRENTGSAEVAFCYPNGEPGDFDEEDQEIIRHQGCSCAVSNQAGANGPGADLYALRRYPIGLYHDRYSFLAEVTGLRQALAG